MNLPVDAHIVAPFQALLAQRKARVILRTRILRPNDLNLRVLSGCRGRLLRALNGSREGMRAVGCSTPIFEG
jgi:hypothetical protein